MLKYIKSWEELGDAKSSTHLLDIDLYYGCGWIIPKQEPLDSQSYEGRHYLSTHTFYGSQCDASTELLQLCGFNVRLANWDELGW